MTVHFVGAGPGAPDLITVRGRDIVARCPVCLYAGSLVPDEIVALAPANARRINTAPLSLGEIIALMREATEAGRMSHGFTPAIFPSGARWANSCANWTGAA